MHAEFSEFSYGFAVVNELIRLLPAPLKAAPVFPSLREEGLPSAGYDVHLNLPGVPVFLQFKLSECLVTWKAREAAAGALAPPYYRFHIRQDPYSQQHVALCNLAQQHAHLVYYVAPAFHCLFAFDRYFLTRTVLQHSVIVSPASIGPLPTGHSHCVAFKRGQSTAYVFSEPRSIESSTADRIIHQISKAVRQETVPFSDRLGPMLRMFPPAPFRWIRSDLDPDVPGLPVSEAALARLARLVATHLGCSLIIVQPDER